MKKSRVFLSLIMLMFCMGSYGQSNPYIEVGNKFIRDGCATGAKKSKNFAKIIEKTLSLLIAETKPNTPSRTDGMAQINDAMQKRLDNVKTSIVKNKQLISKEIYEDNTIKVKDLLIRQWSRGLDSEYFAHVGAYLLAKNNAIEGKERNEEYYEMESYSECLKESKLN